jgi:hypothetical protein
LAAEAQRKPQVTLPGIVRGYSTDMVSFELGLNVGVGALVKRVKKKILKKGLWQMTWYQKR